MTLPYLLKLLSLCLASFFLVHLALALLISLATPAAVRFSARLTPVTAARFLFFLRMLPAAVGALIVAGLCVPSYLWLEPRTAASEEIGAVCLAFSTLTVGLWAVSITRGLRAIIGSIVFLRQCERTAQRTVLPGEALPLWMVEEPAALFAIGGIFRARLLISRQVMSVLSGDQLAAALRHERAHWTSRDNLKRFLLILAPDLVPFLHGFESLVQAWAKYTERAADDLAVAGDAGGSLSLAAALVCVSRLGIATTTPSLAAPLLPGDEDLEARVERLLSVAPQAGAHQRWMGCLISCAAVLLSGTVVMIALEPALLHPVHRLLENLIR
jgi:Zn-dependent protease with chaperone function